MDKLKGKWVLITGASSGIGAASAKLLSEQGYNLVLVARRKDVLKELRSDLDSNCECLVIPTDLGRNEDLENLMAELRSAKIAIDILINSAGSGRWLAMQETPMEEFQDQVRNPLGLTGMTIIKLLPMLLERKEAQIITLNSAAAYFHIPGASGYASSRWGLRGLMNGLHEDLLKTNVKVSTLVAGKVNSPYFDTNVGAEDRIPGITMKLTRSSSPEEIAQLVLKLIKRPRRVLIHPPSMRMMIFLERFFPNIFLYLLRKSSKFYKK